MRIHLNKVVIVSYIYQYISILYLFLYYIRAFDFPNRQIYTDCIIHTNYECTDEFSQFYKRGEHKYNQQVILQIDFSQSANLEVIMPDL